MQAEAQNLCGYLSLGGLAGLLSRCLVLVPNDSCSLHPASAVGTATVGIYWCFNLVTVGILTRSCHRPAISWRLTCPICGIDRSRTSCDHHTSSVADIPMDSGPVVLTYGWSGSRPRVRARFTAQVRLLTPDIAHMAFDRAEGQHKDLSNLLVREAPLLSSALSILA